ncbi:hypothetical protein A5320_02655 [Rheinheimera sp. SA_1]|uniref:type I polyketide synthase n=1 Tax=Rheinheimera sp. SA_1 TaxID=1827365 RepID=UPI000800731A|nr:type I polyketide synthase [Rheinheimera sp. SA_1]OBP16328.1 hypothetical protein A5320_02655 [Rheinheimera sp. SA_1]
MSLQAAKKIAVVGAAVHLPKTRDPEEFWRLLCDKTLFLRELSDETLKNAGVSQALLQQHNYVKWAAPLDDIAAFDADAFAMTPKEAEIAGPQLRSLLHCASDALHNAAIRRDDPNLVIGVFTGVGGSDYMPNNLAGRPDIVASVGHKTVQFGNDNSFVATQIAYKLNLKGPAVNFSTACSSSLVAAHHARKSLLDHECDVALVGGAKISSLHNHGYLYQSGGIRSKDGYCRTFDADASGTVSGNGAVVLVMMRLEDAVAQKRDVWAVLEGSALNNDGAVKVGYTAPGIEGQASVIATALADAQIDPAEIGFVEAHGTATPMGDPVEVAALTAVYRAFTEKQQYCALGAVKSNLGHLGAASGLLGLLKATLAVRDGKIPATLHFKQANPALQLEHSPFFVNADTMDWPAPPQRRLAAVSSFGMGGTNAHMILSGFDNAPKPQDLVAGAADYRLILLSDLTTERLAYGAASLGRRLAESPVSLANVELTLAQGRPSHAVRQALVVNSVGELSAALQSEPHAVVAGQPTLVMMFPGQGAQHLGMLNDLYQTEPCFRQTFDRCAQFLKDHDGLDITDYLQHGQPIPDDTAVVQPLLFAVEYSLYCCWQQLGAVPKLVLGHSLGELVAATVAGCFSLEQGLILVRERGKLMSAAPAGAMLSVDCSPVMLQPMLSAELDIAAINASGNLVIAGPLALLEDLQHQLDLRGIGYRWISRRYAFHSRLMAQSAAVLSTLVDRLGPKPLSLPLLSNLSGAVMAAGHVLDGAYWSQQLLSCVRFDQAAVHLHGLSEVIALEVGPGQVLSQLLKSDGLARAVVASQPHPKMIRKQQACWLDAIAQLWQRGYPLNFVSWLDGRAGHFVALPGPVAVMRDHWVTPTAAVQPALASTGGNGALPESWLHLPQWRQISLTASPATHCFLIVGDDAQLTETLQRLLCQAGACVDVYPGPALQLAQEWQSVTSKSNLQNVEPQPLAVLLLPSAWHPSSGLADQCTTLIKAVGQTAGRAVSLNLLQTPLWDLFDPSFGDVLTARLQALLLCAEQEYPALSCRLIDVDVAAADPADLRVVTQLTAQSAGLMYPTVIRAGQCFQRQFNVAPTVADPQHRLKTGGNYLIIGGLGGIGLVFAEYLASHYQAHLILLSRDPAVASATPTVDAALQRIREKAATVQLVAGDVSQFTVLQSMFAGTSATRRIDGVIHAAGIADSKIIALASDELLSKTAAPKVSGTQHLLTLCQQFPPDFVLLCSSQSALKGGAGQYAYSAANGMMDVLVRQAAKSMTFPTISVNWCRWSESGMATKNSRTRDDRSLDEGISDQEGCRLLEQILQLAQPQVVVSKFVVDEVIQRYRLAQQSRLSPAAVTQAAVRARPALSTPYVAAESPVQLSLIAIWQKILGIDEIGIQDNFFEIGGNSLLLGQLLMLLRTEFLVELTIAQLYNALTVEAMATLIFSQSMASVQDDDLALLLAELEQLDLHHSEQLITQD